jgi:hypothetical protein
MPKSLCPQRDPSLRNHNPLICGVDFSGGGTAWKVWPFESTNWAAILLDTRPVRHVTAASSTSTPFERELQQRFAPHGLAVLARRLKAPQQCRLNCLGS